MERSFSVEVRLLYVVEYLIGDLFHHRKSIDRPELIPRKPPELHCLIGNGRSSGFYDAPENDKKHPLYIIIYGKHI